LPRSLDFWIYRTLQPRAPESGLLPTKLVPSMRLDIAAA
jgi:hypothetical protein